MIQALISRCLGDGDPRCSETRTRCGTAAGWVGIAANLLLFAVKGLCGLFSGSVAMVADAVNNLSDAAGSIVTLIGFRLAGQEADADHPFGHGRIEYIAGLKCEMLCSCTWHNISECRLNSIVRRLSL